MVSGREACVVCVVWEGEKEEERKKERGNGFVWEDSREQQGALSGHLLSMVQVVVARTEEELMRRAAPIGRMRREVTILMLVVSTDGSRQDRRQTMVVPMTAMIGMRMELQELGNRAEWTFHK